MGSSQSTTVNDTISEFNNNLTNIIQTTINNASASCTTKSNIALNFGAGDTINCNINVINTPVTICDLTSTFSGNNSSNVISAITAAIAQTAQSATQSVQDFLATAVSVQNTKMSLSAYMQNIVQTNITQTTCNTCISSATVDANNTITMASNVTVNCPTIGGISVTSNPQLNLLANCISQMVISAVSSDATVANAVQNATTSSTSNQSGLGNVITSIANDITSLGQTWIIIIGLVIVGIIGLVVYFLMSPNGSQFITTAGNVANSAIQSGAGSGSGMPKIPIIP